MDKEKLRSIISEYMPHKWANLIEPLAQAIIDNYPNKQEKIKEWGMKLGGDSIRIDDIASDFSNRPPFICMTLEEWVLKIARNSKTKQLNIEKLNDVFLYHKDSNELYFIGDNNGSIG